MWFKIMFIIFHVNYISMSYIFYPLKTPENQSLMPTSKVLWTALFKIGFP